MRKLLKLATIYSVAVAQLVKEASVISDMAMRIIYSMIPFAAYDEKEARDMKMNLAFSHIIPGAREYVKYGTIAAYNWIKSFKYTTAEDERNLQQEDYRSVLLGLQGRKDHGALMDAIIRQLLIVDELANYIEKTGDMLKIDELIIQLNMADGILHRGDSVFIQKLLWAEHEGSGGPYTSWLKTNKLMDSKNLENIGDLVYFLYPYVSRIRDKTATEIMSRLRRKYPHHSSEEIRAELDKLCYQRGSERGFVWELVDPITKFIEWHDNFVERVNENPDGPWDSSEIRHHIGTIPWYLGSGRTRWHKDIFADENVGNQMLQYASELNSLKDEINNTTGAVFTPGTPLVCPPVTDESIGTVLVLLQRYRDIIDKLFELAKEGNPGARQLSELYFPNIWE